MNWLEEIRKNYDIKQEELAVCLSVSRSTVSKTEHGQRDLPAAAMILLANFFEQPAVPFTGDLALRLQQHEERDTALAAKQAAWQVRDSALKLTRAQRKLAAMQQRHTQAINALQLAQRQRALPSPGEKETAHREAFINNLVAKAFSALENNGPAAQAILQTTIKMHEAIVGEG